MSNVTMRGRRARIIVGFDETDQGRAQVEMRGVGIYPCRFEGRFRDGKRGCELWRYGETHGYVAQVAVV